MLLFALVPHYGASIYLFCVLLIFIQSCPKPLKPTRLLRFLNNTSKIQNNTISFNGTKTPQLTQAQLGITREKKLNNIAYWKRSKRQKDEYFLSYFMITEKHNKFL